MSTEAIDFRIFEATPGMSVILRPDAPVYTLVAVSDDFVRMTGRSRHEVVGRSHFEVFPGSAHDPQAVGEQNLRASFGYVVQQKESHSLPVERYDTPNGDGTYSERYWKISNSPVLTDAGEVQYILHAAVEVTDKVKAEQRLQAIHGLEKQNEELQFIRDFVPMMIWHTLPDGYADFFNQVYLDYTGCPPEQLYGSGWTRLLHPDDVELTARVWQQALDGRSYYEIEHRLRRHDGVYRWFLTRSKALKDDSGQIIKWYGVTADIEDRKQEEALLERRIRERTAALEQQRAFTNSVLDASLNGIYSIEAIRDSGGVITDFRLLFINKVYAQAVGAASEEIIGKTVRELIPGGLNSNLLDFFSQVLESGEPLRRQTQYGGRWFENSSVKMSDDVLVVTFQEITAEKNAALLIEEQRNLYEGVLKYSPAGITVYKAIRDAEGRVKDFHTILANDAAEEYTGISKEIRYEKTVLEITPELKETPLFGMAVAAVEKGRPFRTEFYNERIRRWLELSVVKLSAERLINVFRDITPEKEVQLQLEKHIEELKRSNANLEEFAYAASHDMKEPVRKIRFFADRLKSSLSSQLTDDQRRHLERMEQAAKRMSNLIDDLLLYSFVTRGATLETVVDLNQKIALVLEDLELEVQQRGAKIRVDHLPSIRGHRRQLQQLFQNLVSNALKYSEPGVPPEVRITARRVMGSEMPLLLTSEEAGKHYHLIEVHDNGIGFEQRDADRIFQVFTRLHGNSEYMGSGVGLSIVKKIVDNHHGYVWAESEPGNGATFKILLPAE